jgi:hypothetical protein
MDSYNPAALPASRIYYSSKALYCIVILLVTFTYLRNYIADLRIACDNAANLYNNVRRFMYYAFARGQRIALASLRRDTIDRIDSGERASVTRTNSGHGIVDRQFRSSIAEVKPAKEPRAYPSR